MAQLQPGDKAPEFDLPDQTGRRVRLSEYIGRKVLLYFYPKADTPGCTKQTCSVQDARVRLKTLGADAIGISPDPVAAQRKFADKYHVEFPLLADEGHQVADAYGVWGEKVRNGKKSMGIIRSSFLIDEKGRIAQTWYAVSPEQTVPLAQEAIGRMAG